MSEKKKVHHRTKEADRIPWKERFAYSSGCASMNLQANAINQFAFYVLNIGLGISPVLVGLLQAVPRLWDAVTDPVMGYISDRTVSAHGRRKPYIFWGAMAAGITFMLMWQLPRAWAPTLYFWVFFALSILYYTFVTVFSVPWIALGYELTPDYHERTRLMALTQFVASAVMLAMNWMLPLTQLSCFKDTPDGMRYVAVPLGLAMIATGVVPPLFCRERVQENKAAAALPAQKAGGSFLAVCRNRPFMLLSFTVLSMLTGIMTVGGLTGYIIIYYFFNGDMKAGSLLIATNATVWTVGSMAMVPVVAFAGTHLGKKITMQICLALALLGNASKWWLYRPEHPWTVLIPQLFVATGFACLWTLVNSMIADTCDYGELKSGQRQQGLYGGIYGWIMKLGGSLAFALSGVVLSRTGFDQALGGVQNSGVITNMRLFETGIPTLCYLIALILVSLYPLTEAKSYEIKQTLEERQ